MCKYKFVVVYFNKTSKKLYYLLFHFLNKPLKFISHSLEPRKTAKNILNKLPISEHDRIRMVPHMICFCDPV